MIMMIIILDENESSPAPPRIKRIDTVVEPFVKTINTKFPRVKIDRAIR